MWNEEAIDEVEDVYIGMWNSSVGASKLKVFIDAVRKFDPHIVVEALEYIAKTQDKDLRPSISTITQVCRDKSPKEPIRRQPSPCDNGEDDGESVSFREYFRRSKDVEVPAFMLKFLDEDDPRRKTNGKNLDDSPDTDNEQPKPSDALGGKEEGRPGLASGNRGDLRKRERARTD